MWIVVNRHEFRQTWTGKHRRISRGININAIKQNSGMHYRQFSLQKHLAWYPCEGVKMVQEDGRRKVLCDSMQSQVNNDQVV